MNQTHHSPANRRQAVLLLWLVNIAVGVVVGANWLVHVPDGPEGSDWRLLAFALPALVSSVVFLTLIPGLAFVFASAWARPRVLGWVQGFCWMLFQAVLFIDTRVFNVFRYHLVNGQVWSLVYMEGSEDSVHVSTGLWIGAGIGLCIGTVVQTWLWNRALQISTETQGRFWLRPSIIWCGLLLPAVFVEKTLYAQANLNRDQQVTALARLFPAYARVPAEDLASKVFGVDVAGPPRIEIQGVALDYPQAMPQVAPDAPRPNVLVIAIDCLRADMLEPETMPELSAWADAGRTRRFEDHVSGGNSTRFGLFSMLYGLYGSYWIPVLQERRSPVLVDVLAEEGYDFGVFASANMLYPELRSTAWSAIPGDVHDDFPAETSWERDEQAGAALSQWLSERDGETPFFGFVLLDAPHQTYGYPPGQEPFQPSATELDYLQLTNNEGPPPGMIESVRNRYKNAVYHADRVAAGILRTLEDTGLADDTLVFVTGDHGEEFRECGFFGHTSAFTPEQVRVPLVVRGPGVAPGLETRPTSHLDFAATILERLGADPRMRADWSLGGNLFEPELERRRVQSGWNELGLWTKEGIVRVPLGLLEFDLEVYDYKWQLVADDAELLEREAEALSELGAACNRFLVPQPGN